MKYKDLFKRLEDAGCLLQRHGGRHDLWFSPITGKMVAVPRHGTKEVPKGTLKAILRDLGA